MTDYKMLEKQLISLGEASCDMVAVMANASALLYEGMADINWAGFYLVKNGELILGPFQGKVACVRIEKGKGVCGTAWEKDEILLVPNVHEFPGHIACDAASNSEIVLPIHTGDGCEGEHPEVIGVLDIDSPSLERFTEEDKAGLTVFVKALETIIAGGN